ncbi:MAG: DUF4923 family protein [Pedobacter sp.]|nr:DUF4923 family protein [Chitinophagaceae bacterium]
MKKLFVSIAIIFFVATAFTNIQTPEIDILGKWKMDKNSAEPMTKAMIAIMPKTNPEQADKLETDFDKVNEIMASTTYQFKADNTFTVQSNADPLPGTWAFSDDKKYISLTRNGKTRKDSIVELSATRLQLLHADRKVVTLFVRP